MVDSKTINKIIPAKSLTLNKNLDVVFTIPISYKMETYEDKYNRNELILRGPMFSNLSEIPVENFVSNYMSFNNKIYEILDLDKIFDKFVQIERKEEDYQGTGLGLAIVKHVLQRHNSKLMIFSEPKKGSSFSFSLPAELLPKRKAIKVR